MGWAILISLTYGLATLFLRRWVRIDLQLKNTRDLLWLLLASAVGSVILAIVSVSGSVSSGLVPEAERLPATAQWWIGEMIGILVVTPTLLIHVMPWVKRFVNKENSAPPKTFPLPVHPSHVLGQLISILVTLSLIFFIQWPNNFHPVLLIAIPLVWIALDHGVAGASLGVLLVNFTITLGLSDFQFDPAGLAQTQLIMFVVCSISLFIGIVITKNKEPEQDLTAEMEQRQRTIRNDLLIIFISALAIWLFEYSFNFYKAISEWEKQYRVKGIDETLITVLFLCVASAIFSYRRSREVQAEMAERQKAEAELKKLYNELEARVQERTADLSNANTLLQRYITERKQAGEALQKSEAQLVEAMEIAELGAWEYDVASDQFTFTDQFYALYRTTAEQEGGYKMSSAQYAQRFIHPEDQAVVNVEIQKVMETSDPNYRAQLDHRIIRANGENGYVTVHIRIEKDAQGRTFRTHGVNQDITARKEAETALQQSEKRFRALIENNADAITLLDVNGNVLYDSPAAPGMLGYGSEEWIDRFAFDLLHPDDFASTMSTFQSLIQKPGSLTRMMFRLHHRNGSWVWIEAAVTNLLNDPSVGAIVANYRNITERVLAEETLRISEDRYRDLVNNSHDLICTHDLQGNLLSVNPYAEQKLGYPTGALLGKNLIDFLAPKTRELFAWYLSEIQTHGVAEGLITVQTITGEERIWKYRNTLRTEGVDRPIVRGMARDITERKKAEEEILSLSRFPAENPNQVLRLTLDGTILYSNKSSESLINFWEGQGYHQTAPDEIKEKLIAAFQAGENQEFELEFAGRTFAYILTPILDSEYVNLYGRDVTNLKLAEAEKLRQAERTNTLARVAQHLNAQLDLKTVLKLVCEETKQALGLSASSLMLYNEKRDVFELASTCGLPQDVLAQVPALTGELQKQINQNDGSVLLLKDISMLSNSASQLFMDAGIRSLASVELKREGKFIGLLNAINIEFNSFGEDDISLLKGLADLAAQAISNARLYEEFERRYRRTQALHNIDAAISNSLNLKLTLNIILGEVVTQLNADASDILLVTPHTQMLEMGSSYGFRFEEKLKNFSIHIGDGMVGKLALKREMLHIRHLEKYDDVLLRRQVFDNEKIRYLLWRTASGQRNAGRCAGSFPTLPA